MASATTTSATTAIVVVMASTSAARTASITTSTTAMMLVKLFEEVLHFLLCSLSVLYDVPTEKQIFTSQRVIKIYCNLVVTDVKYLSKKALSLLVL